jgi:hypothetical protein
VLSSSKFFKKDEVAPITDVEHVVGVLTRLDQGIATNNDAIINLVDDYHLEHVKAGDAITALWLRLEVLAATVRILATHDWTRDVSHSDISMTQLGNHSHELNFDVIHPSPESLCSTNEGDLERIKALEELLPTQLTVLQGRTWT